MIVAPLCIGTGIEDIPGDPAALAQAASVLAAAGQAAGQAGGQLSSAASGLTGPVWSGQGAIGFGDAATRLTSEHQCADTALGGAAGALARFATVLASCQAEVQAAKAAVGDATATAAASNARLDAQAAAHPGPSPAVDAARAQVQSDLQTAVGAAQSRAATAWSTYRSAAAATAGQIADHTAEGHGVLERLGAFNDKAGFGLVPVGLGLLAPAARASRTFLQTESVLEESLRANFSDQIGPLALAADRGELSWEAVAAKTDSFMTLYERASALGKSVAADDFVGQGLPSVGGLGTVAKWGGRVIGAGAIASDALTILYPDDTGAVGNLDRGMAAANGVATAAMTFAPETMAGLATADGIAAAVPVAGEVVIAGTTLYLAGDWAYHNVQWFHDGVDTVGTGLADAGKGIATGLVDAGKGIADGVVGAGQGIADGVSAAASWLGL